MYKMYTDVNFTMYWKLANKNAPVGCGALLKSKIVVREGSEEDDAGDVVETRDPLSPFFPLSSNIYNLQLYSLYVEHVLVNTCRHFSWSDIYDLYKVLFKNLWYV